MVDLKHIFLVNNIHKFPWIYILYILYDIHIKHFSHMIPNVSKHIESTQFFHEKIS